MPRTIIINQSHAVDSQPGTFVFPFKGSLQFTDKSQISVASVALPYSWFNITAANDNTSFSYAIKGTSYSVNIPPGFYSVDTLNLYLQYVMKSNGHYLQTVSPAGTTTDWFPITLSTNSTYYAVQITCTPIPAALPSGWVNPANVFYNTITPSGHVPQLIIPATNIQSFFGLPAAMYPLASNTTTQFNQLSTYTPQVTPVSSIIVRCNLCNNNLTNPPDALYTFTPKDTAFGSNIVDSASSLVFVSVNPGWYQELRITLTDQNYTTLFLNDSNICMQLVIMD